jgi:hypothetical protein
VFRGWIGAAFLGAALVAGCATPSLGRGGPIYEVTIDSVDDHATALRGPAAYPACTVQVGDHAARVWLASSEASEPSVSPPLLRADAAALQAGVLIESSWTAAIVHAVTEEELAVGAATVHVPYVGGYHVVELRFRRVPVGVMITHDQHGALSGSRAEN